MRTRSGKAAVDSSDSKNFLLLSHVPSSSIYGFGNLPVELFQDIHSYLSHYEYRQFMNSSLSLFSAVKYETVYYIFSEVHEWKELFPEFSDKQLRDYCKEMIDHNVKDKGKQIAMQIDFQLKSEINLYSELYQGIHLLIVNFASCKCSPRQFSFHDIENLELSNFDSVRSLDEFLQLANIHVLRLSDFPELVDISRVKDIKTLKHVDLSDCPQLEDISPLKDFTESFFRQCCAATDFSSLEKHEHITFSDFINDVTITSEHLSHLKMAKIIEIACKIESCSSLKENVGLLNLTLMNEATFSPVVPVLHSLVYLFLGHCDLSLWTPDQLLPNLQELTLRNCKGVNFISFRNVNVLKLNYFHELPDEINLSSFLKLQVLFVEGCNTVKEIISPLQLKDLNVFSCSKLTRISNLSGVKILKVQDCKRFSELEGLTQLKSIALEDLPFYRDFSILLNVPRVSLEGFNSALDISFAQHAKTLSLERCNNLSYLSMLGNVDEIVICSCNNVKTLKGLDNVRKLSVWDCPLRDLDGLSNNKEVRLLGVSKALCDKFNNGRYRYLKEVIPDIVVSENLSTSPLSFTLFCG
jgi:hypothetical protein